MIAKTCFISAVIPALDEENSVGKVVSELKNLKIGTCSLIDEVIVCDNGSKDDTAINAQTAGARVVKQPTPGYGIACLTAIAALDKRCEIVLFVDGDDSCYTPQAHRLIDGIAAGDDLSIGSRTLGKMQKGSLTTAQLFGNWLAARLIKLLYGKTVTDLGPFRAIKKSALDALNMQDKTFGWTVEMQVKAIKQKMQIGEYPVDSKVRIGKSKISGTVKGTVLAGAGIISMIFRLY